MRKPKLLSVEPEIAVTEEHIVAWLLTTRDRKSVMIAQPIRRTSTG
jgi:hypothetical protein